MLENQRHLTSKRIDSELLAQQKSLLLQPVQPVLEPFEPCDQWAVEGSSIHRDQGRQLMAQGRCGCLVVAGGQGTRLGSNAPKGTFPVTLIKHKSLFQLLADRVLAAGRQVGCTLPLAIMTSEENDSASRAFFKQHAYFGLKPSQIDFFNQASLPLLDDRGDLVMEAPGQAALGPDGNGMALSSLYRAGIWQKWFEQGVRHLAFIQIDNALADPFDAELFGYHTTQSAEVTVKATHRVDPGESVGVLVQKKGHLQVVEYTEMADEERFARRTGGMLNHTCANLSLFCFEMSFVERIAQVTLPLHLARKTMRTDGGERLVWKFERFIFDILPYAKKTAVIVYPREHCFAPLKNRTGQDSLQSVQEALLKRDKQVYAEVIGHPVAEDVFFELSQEFYYPTPDLLIRCRQSPPLPTGYVA